MRLPPPVTELTLAQEFEIDKATRALPQGSREDIEKMVITLMRQNFMLKGTITNLVIAFPNEV